MPDIKNTGSEALHIPGLPEWRPGEVWSVSDEQAERLLNRPELELVQAPEQPATPEAPAAVEVSPVSAEPPAAEPVPEPDAAVPPVEPPADEVPSEPGEFVIPAVPGEGTV